MNKVVPDGQDRQAGRRGREREEDRPPGGGNTHTELRADEGPRLVGGGRKASWRRRGVSSWDGGLERRGPVQTGPGATGTQARRSAAGLFCGLWAQAAGGRAAGSGGRRRPQVLRLGSIPPSPARREERPAAKTRSVGLSLVGHQECLCRFNSYFPTYSCLLCTCRPRM